LKILVGNNNFFFHRLWIPSTIFSWNFLTLDLNTDKWRWMLRPKTTVDWTSTLFFHRVLQLVWHNFTSFRQVVWIHYQTFHWHFILFKLRSRHAKYKKAFKSSSDELLLDLYEFVANVLEYCSWEKEFFFTGSKSNQPYFVRTFKPLTLLVVESTSINIFKKRLDTVNLQPYCKYIL
jgi:hypothetical protein